MAIRNLCRRYTFGDLDLYFYTMWVGKAAEWTHGYMVSFYFGVSLFTSDFISHSLSKQKEASYKRISPHFQTLRWTLGPQGSEQSLPLH